MPQNEDDFECSEERKNTFKIDFFRNGTYLRTQSFGTDIVEDSGTFNIINGQLNLTFKIGISSATHKIPILSYSNNMLVLDYNLCALRDEISTAKLILIK